MKNEFDDVTHNETLTAFTNMVCLPSVLFCAQNISQAVAYVIPPDSHYRII